VEQFDIKAFLDHFFYKRFIQVTKVCCVAQKVVSVPNVIALVSENLSEKIVENKKALLASPLDLKLRRSAFIFVSYSSFVLVKKKSQLSFSGRAIDTSFLFQFYASSAG
jgi:hypothetical protein